MEMDLIERWAKITLAALSLVALVGMVYHGWLSSRLAFVRFTDTDTKNKKGLKRIIVPGIVVFLLCAIAPVAIVYSHRELLEALESPDAGGFVTFPWNYIMPTVSMEVSIIVCALIGSVLYLGMGLASLAICRILVPLLTRHGNN